MRHLYVPLLFVVLSAAVALWFAIRFIPYQYGTEKKSLAEVLYVPHHFQVLSNNIYYSKKATCRSMIAFAFGVEQTPAHNAIQRSKSQSTLNLI
jgi:hypothetical protein